MKTKYIRTITLLLLLFHSIEGKAESFQNQLLREGIPKTDIDILVRNGYTDIVSLKTLSITSLLKMNITETSSSLIRKIASGQNTPVESSVQTKHSELSVKWQSISQSLQAIRNMQKDTYEKTSEFQARRQIEVDKIITQINTASQKGNPDYQVAVATIKSYDADAERLVFAISWFHSLKNIVEIKDSEMLESMINIAPQYARNFPIGQKFPLFASVYWRDDHLYQGDIWLDRADLRELQAESEREKQRKLDEKARLEQEKIEMEQAIVKQKALMEEQAKIEELLLQKRQAESVLKQLTQQDFFNKDIKKDYASKKHTSSITVAQEIFPPTWCKYAKTNVEHLICNGEDKALWYFDRQLEQLYYKYGKPKNQIQWLKLRDLCNNTICLKKMYINRINTINK